MKIPISSIVVGERRRQDMGDLDVLADSIRHWGLINPITIDDASNLIAGGRRLEACKRLSLTEVEVKSHGDLSAEDRAELELEENLRRKDLTPAEASRVLLGRAAMQEHIMVQRTLVESPTFSATVAEKVGMGRPKAAVTQEEVARALGVGARTLDYAKAHVAAVATYPALDHPRVSQKEAIRVAAELDAMREEERASVLAEIAARPAKRTQPPRARRPVAPQPKPRVRRPRRSVADLPSMTRFLKCLGQLEEALVALEADGGLDHAVKTWPEDEREGQRADVRRIAGLLSAMAAERQEVA